MALLRAIDMMKADGPVKTKLKISKMGPASALKDLLNHVQELALNCFENLPPGVACIRADELTPTTTSSSSESTPMDMQMMEPGVYAQVPDYMDPMGGAPCGMAPLDGGHLISPTEYYGWSEPPRMTMPANTSMTTQMMTNMCGAPPPPGMMGPQDMMMDPMGASQMAPAALATPAGSAPPAPAGEHMWPPDMWGQPPMYHQSAPYMPFPYGMPYHRLNEARRKCGFDSSDLFPTTKKGPSVGDRPLTPPAQGWYAKYSSGVTGVVWDRVHQAWVVSWTLAGKRTFRHFTCKSYGGFDKAREAAIEFRLARNREIAAYNKRCKDKK